MAQTERGDCALRGAEFGVCARHHREAEVRLELLFLVHELGTRGANETDTALQVEVALEY